MFTKYLAVISMHHIVFVRQRCLLCASTDGHGSMRKSNILLPHWQDNVSLLGIREIGGLLEPTIITWRERNTPKSETISWNIKLSFPCDSSLQFQGFGWTQPPHPLVRYQSTARVNCEVEVLLNKYLALTEYVGSSTWDPWEWRASLQPIIWLLSQKSDTHQLLIVLTELRCDGLLPGFDLVIIPSIKYQYFKRRSILFPRWCYVRCLFEEHRWWCRTSS